ncbi:exo-beta-N-acetylmuramidase NamZ family protein [Christiangramia forsetii]|uniref:Secreted protein containing DUF1343 n=2 Tax=Christiangramia forsetii TaxID=411153 RepID=A0M413_CHRFK|nr:DUF1343 domain-containing protein [Christiangramia forsetii]GGG24474.1 hypothetical protein GCM10011532_04700 [Christiangramia forsetii]CAL67358.1 secreted protein containing DUF1343 [Christiangramia forsetii KT0803]
MIKRLLKSTFLFFLIGILSCGNTNNQSNPVAEEIAEAKKQEDTNLEIITGANQTEEYLPLLKNKTIGIVGNQTSIIKSEKGNFTHLVDSLQSLNIQIKKVFAPEHGFRGTADAGEIIKDGIDTKTGLLVVSLYGKNKKPSSEVLKGIDLMVFDIQDVGARFYTYISTLHYIMEACAENDIPLLILDRPNPNGHYIDGPILNPKFQSFVGMHPIPVVHGLTIAEYAKMINGEKWLKDGVQCKLNIVKIKNYDHSKNYSLPVKPSPNLPNDQAINLYPSLCFFEGTNVNAGRGTSSQFQVFGSPFLSNEYYSYSYTPKSMEGAQNPKHSGVMCIGKNLRETENLNKLNLEWLIAAYNNTSDKSKFFNSFFTKLAGTERLQEQIESGKSSEEIKASWAEGLEDFEKKREQYLLYQ